MLRHAQKMEAIGQLTGGVAHDFNNMLTVVLANLELLARRLTPESPLRTYVDRAMKGAARGAMPDGGRLTLTASNTTLGPIDLGADGILDAGDFVAVAVADTGTGMTPEVSRAAFEPFFTTKPVGHGSGLGLSQVYGFVRQSRGHVTLDSTPGQGTTVTLYLRRAMPDTDPAADPAGAITFG
jgi:signal transduction histidine kinase